MPVARDTTLAMSSAVTWQVAKGEQGQTARAFSRLLLAM